jgi:glycosyltransferase involved in cell wall biosynthesis
MDVKDITITVPVKNERQNIVPFLKSLPQEIHLIVVDASEDKTCELIRQTRPDNTRILHEHSTIAAARQKGASAANTEWLLFTDADMVFADDYFEQLRQITLPAQYGGIVGAKCSRDRYRRYYRLFSLWLRLICFLGIPAASGSNMLIRRRAFYAAGGFEQALTCNEDSLMMWKVSRCGYRVAYCGQLKVYEIDHRRLDKGMIRKTLHSILRCILLFSGLLPQKYRNNDWGYWNS